MYKFKITSRYRKDFKNLQNNRELVEELLLFLQLLQHDEDLPEKYKDHSLKGKLIGYRECHIKPDILLIYKKNNFEKIIILARIGNHQRLRLS